MDHLTFIHETHARAYGLLPSVRYLERILGHTAQTAGGIGEIVRGDMAIGITNFVLVAASVVLFLDLVLDKEPLNIENIIRDLKLEDPPRWALWRSLWPGLFSLPQRTPLFYSTAASPWIP